MRTSTKFAFVAAAALIAASTTQTALANAKVYRHTLKSTTWIIAKAENGYSTGSGVLVDLKRKWVVSNYHVVGDSKDVLVFFPQHKDEQLIAERQHYINGADSFGIRARVVMVDKKRDLAIVELSRLPENTPAIELNEVSAGPGDGVHSIGNPTASGVLWPYTPGTVRAVYQKQFRTQAGPHNMRIVETSSPINPGDSGGPVVNDEGKLIGISQSLDPKARLMSYCVDISEVKAFLQEVIDYNTITLPDVLAKSGLQFTPQGRTAFAADLRMNEGGTQRVFVSAKLESYEQAETRKIWSLATVSKQALSAEMLTKLMEQSARAKIGAWVIEKNAQGEYLVMFCAKVDAGASPQALRNSVEFVSKVAASMKQQIAASVSLSRTRTSSSDRLGSS